MFLVSTLIFWLWNLNSFISFSNSTLIPRCISRFLFDWCIPDTNLSTCLLSVLVELRWFWIMVRKHIVSCFSTKKNLLSMVSSDHIRSSAYWLAHLHAKPIKSHVVDHLIIEMNLMRQCRYLWQVLFARWYSWCCRFMVVPSF